MKAFNFFKVDLLRCKTQLKLILVMMAFFAIFFTFEEGDISFACGYLSFLAVMFSVQPFTLESKSECGFVDMLPGQTNDRVYGRFLYTTMVLGLAFIISLITIGVYVAGGKTVDNTMLAGFIALAGGVLIFCSIEILILYSIGKGRSQQFMTLAQMIPGIVMFLGLTSVLKYLSAHPEIDLSWIMDRQIEAASAVLIFGVVLFLITIQISKVIVRKRDYE